MSEQSFVRAENGNERTDLFSDDRLDSANDCSFAHSSVERTSPDSEQLFCAFAQNKMFVQQGRGNAVLKMLKGGLTKVQVTTQVKSVVQQ